MGVKPGDLIIVNGMQRWCSKLRLVNPTLVPMPMAPGGPPLRPLPLPC